MKTIEYIGSQHDNMKNLYEMYLALHVRHSTCTAFIIGMIIHTLDCNLQVMTIEMYSELCFALVYL